MEFIFSKWYLVSFFLVFFLLVFVVRSYLLWKNTGINPFTFTKVDNAHNFNGQMFKFLVALEFVIIGIYAFGGNIYEYLLPFWYLDNSSLRIIGWSILHLSLIWIFIAQLQMSNSWRIGIDEKNPGNLITHGLFQVSRNPIFLGILAADIGMFLVLPNAFTLLIAVLSITVVQTQVRLEEDFLKQEYQQIYIDYSHQVRRWV